MQKQFSRFTKRKFGTFQKNGAPSQAQPSHGHKPFQQKSYQQPAAGGQSTPAYVRPAGAPTYNHAQGDRPAYGQGGRPFGRKPFGGRGGSRPGFRKPMQKSRRVVGTTININMLINKVNDEAVVKPVEQVITHQFADFKMDPRIKNNVKFKGYITPTPIQDQSIPVGLEGKDVIGIANTGTGKTAAFLLPLLNKMLDNRSQKALILAPTRELALQINEELLAFSKGFNLPSILCIGGSNIVFQIRLLKRPFNFIIGTPGRIMDLMNRKLLDLSGFHNVVLDEADRMVDMGFINDIRMILGKLPRERQSFFFTATLEPKIEELIRQFLNNPVKVSVKLRDTSGNVDQDIVRVPSDSKAKLRILIEHLNMPGFDKVLVFGRTKHGVEKISKAILEAGIRSDSIHGNKSQNYRIKALQRFKKGEVKVLVATDVAARGLDISAVSHVINFDIPANYDDYIHRIGRTGRADRKGVALTFVHA